MAETLDWAAALHRARARERSSRAGGADSRRAAQVSGGHGRRCGGAARGRCSASRGPGALGLDDQNLQPVEPRACPGRSGRDRPRRATRRRHRAQLVDPVRRGEPDDGHARRRGPPRRRPARPRPRGSRAARRRAARPRADRHRDSASRAVTSSAQTSTGGTGRPARARRAVAMRRTPEVATAQLPPGKRVEQTHRAGQRPHRGGLGLVHRNERLDLRLGIEVRCGQPDGLDRAAPMADTQKRLGPEPAGARPPTPLLLDVGGGVHQDPIEIEENRASTRSVSWQPIMFRIIRSR